MSNIDSSKHGIDSSNSKGPRAKFEVDIIFEAEAGPTYFLSLPKSTRGADDDGGTQKRRLDGTRTEGRGNGTAKRARWEGNVFEQPIQRDYLGTLLTCTRLTNSPGRN